MFYFIWLLVCGSHVFSWKKSLNLCILCLFCEDECRLGLKRSKKLFASHLVRVLLNILIDFFHYFWRSFGIFCFSLGGAFLVAGSKDATVSIFYINNNKPMRVGRISAHSNEVNSIQYAYTTNRFISGSKDGTVRMWSYDAKKKWNSILIDTSYSHKT